MTHSLDLSICKPANHLWSELLEDFGLEKAHQAIRQAIDIQAMNGGQDTLPILFIKTGGIALISFELLKVQTGLKLEKTNKVILYCPQGKLFQVLHEIKRS